MCLLAANAQEILDGILARSNRDSIGQNRLGNNVYYRIRHRKGNIFGRTKLTKKFFTIQKITKKYNIIFLVLKYSVIDQIAQNLARRELTPAQIRIIRQLLAKRV